VSTRALSYFCFFLKSSWNVEVFLSKYGALPFHHRRGNVELRDSKKSPSEYVVLLLQMFKLDDS
jgi:hypothetical protein